MHILLTDRLICPRCGPGFGLILLADRIENRRVLGGLLGCSNCREQFPIVDGLGDLRFPPGPPLPSAAAGEPDPEAALRLGALLGITAGGGLVVIVGPGARLAPALSALVDDLEVAAVDPNLAGLEEQAGVSRFVGGGILPFVSRSVRGVALTGSAGELLDEAARVVAPGGRVVVDGADPETADRLRALGLRVLLDEEGTAVASPPVAGVA